MPVPTGPRTTAVDTDDGTPPGIRPFESHGVDLTLSPSGQAIGECPFCGTAGKFYVNALTGLWDCKDGGCRLSGNALDFLRRLHEVSYTGKDDYDELALDRGLLNPDTLYPWGVCKSVTTGEWIVPGYNLIDGELRISQLYRYAYLPSAGKYRLLATPKLHSEEYSIAQGLFGANLFDPSKQDVHLVESLWDGLVEWELLGKNINVLATPGCTTFFESWVQPFFKGKRVTLLFNSDHPKRNKQTNNLEEARGFQGMKRVAGILKGVPASQKPESTRYIRWGPDGYDPELKDGYDIRDCVTTSDDGTPVPQDERSRRLRNLFSRLDAVPDAWPAVRLGSAEITPLHCEDWKTLVDAWRKSMEWHTRLGNALAVLLSAVISTDQIGNAQLWIRLMGAPSSGKTTLCEAMAIAKRYVKSVSVFTGFHSGYKTDKEGEEDHSLIPHVNHKTFIIKEADTLLKMKNREQVMSEFRDIFDGVSRAHFRHGLNREYDDLHLTVVISGTEQLLELDAAESGARFIDCYVVDGVDLKMEIRATNRIIEDEWKNIGRKANCRQDTKGDPERIKCRRMTAGYVVYLREHAERLIDAVNRDNTAERDRVNEYARFVTYMRGRPPKKQTEKVSKEKPFRLGAQYSRLAVCLAAVMGKTEIDKDVSKIVRQVAIDTAQGKTLRIVEFLHRIGAGGCDFKSLWGILGGREDTAKEYTQFLKAYGVLQEFDFRANGAWMTAVKRWRLDPTVRDLYTKVMKDI